MSLDTGTTITEAALVKLLDKFQRWLEQQPEYPVLFLNDRQTRRRTSKALAKAMMTIPHGKGLTMEEVT